MRNGVSVVLTQGEHSLYVELVDGLHSSIGKVGRKHLTRKTIEALVQGALVQAITGAGTPAVNLDSALQYLRKSSPWPVVPVHGRERLRRSAISRSVGERPAG
jgi:hypothetical protein